MLAFHSVALPRLLLCLRPPTPGPTPCPPSHPQSAQKITRSLPAGSGRGVVSGQTCRCLLSVGRRRCRARKAPAFQFLILPPSRAEPASSAVHGPFFPLLLLGPATSCLPIRTVAEGESKVFEYVRMFHLLLGTLHRQERQRGRPRGRPDLM